MQMKIIISHGDVFTCNANGDIYPGADIYIKDGKILAVAPLQPPFKATDADLYLDATGCNVLPGFINAHGHLALGLFRGLGEFVPGMMGDSYFDQQAAIGKQLTLEDYHAGAQVLIAEMIRAGITSFADINYEGANALPISDAAAQAAEASGLRAVFSLETSGYVNVVGTHMRYVRDEVVRSLKASIEFAKKWHQRGDGRITAMLGLANPPAPQQYEMEQVAIAAKEHGFAIQMHIAEFSQEMEEWQEFHQTSAVEMMRRTGILDNHVLGGNVIYLKKEDAQILRDFPFHASTCPKNCCKMVLGMLDIPLMLSEGLNVCLGTNEVVNNNHLDMLSEMRMAALYHKMQANDPAILWGDAPLRLATECGGRALGTGAGVLEPGRPADVILMDNTGAHMQPNHDRLANLIYSSHASDTRTMIVDGKLVMHDRKILTFDADKPIEFLRSRTESLRGYYAPRVPKEIEQVSQMRWQVEL
jgi:5-methylthioadenosine/S-adenosylhomocysteine deaminase